MYNEDKTLLRYKIQNLHLKDSWVESSTGLLSDTYENYKLKYKIKNNQK